MLYSNFLCQSPENCCRYTRHVSITTGRPECDGFSSLSMLEWPCLDIMKRDGRCSWGKLHPDIQKGRKWMLKHHLKPCFVSEDMVVIKFHMYFPVDLQCFLRLDLDEASLAPLCKWHCPCFRGCWDDDFSYGNHGFWLAISGGNMSVIYPWFQSGGWRADISQKVQEDTRIGGGTWFIFIFPPGFESHENLRN